MLHRRPGRVHRDAQGEEGRGGAEHQGHLRLPQDSPRQEGAGAAGRPQPEGRGEAEDAGYGNDGFSVS